MPAAPIPPEADAFLRRPNPCVMGTVRRDGAPFTATTWYDWDGEHLVLNLAASRARLRHLRRDPRVSVTVFDIPNWYWQFTILGRVDAITDDADFRGIDAMARRYIGSDYPDHSAPRVSVTVVPESWNGWDPVNYTAWQAGVTQPPA